MKDLNKEIRKVIRESLGKEPRNSGTKKNLEEAYVTQAKKFDLTTELLSEKNKQTIARCGAPRGGIKKGRKTICRTASKWISKISSPIFLPKK